MKKISLLVITLITNISLIFAQYADEALRYSYVIPVGTARSAAMAASFNGVGGDAGNLYFNPAGLAVYRSTELSITPSFEFGNSKTSYLGAAGNDFKLGGGLNSFSAILSINTSTNNNINFGIAYTNLNSFNNNILFRGQNFNNSMTDYFAARGNGTYYEQLDDYYSGLAWDGYLINPTDSAATNYTSMYNNYGIRQRQQILRSGNQGEFSFSFAGSINRKIFLGATLGLQTINYSEVKVFSEEDNDNLVNDFVNFNFDERLSVRGTGINLKLGFLVNPVDWLRIGAAFHTPTFFNIDENYSTYLSSTFDTMSYTISSPEGVNEYQLNSPFRFNASAGFIIKNIALINIDYEYLNYSSAKLRSDYDAFDLDNEIIKNNYSHGHNVRLGVEYIVTDYMALRTGIAYYGTPYKDPQTTKNFTLAYSGGIGFKIKSLFLDFSYTFYDFADDLYYSYDGYGVSSPLANIEINKNRLSATIGLKF